MGMRKVIVGVMGGGEGASEEVCRLAYELGRLIAQEGWVLLNGGRDVGVMDASAKGSPYIDIPILTGFGDGRNYINVLSSNVVVALPGRTGTISEIALALKNGRTVILLDFDLGDLFSEYRKAGLMISVKKPEEVIREIKKILADSHLFS